MSIAKNYLLVSLLSVVSKNNSLVDHLEKCGFVSDSQYDFRSSQSAADLLTVASDKIARGFNRSGAIQVVALDISKAFDRVWHACLLHKLKFYGISGQIFVLISSFFGNRQYGVLQGSILGPKHFLLYINNLLDDVIYNIDVYAYDITLYSSVIRHLIYGNN